MRISGCSSDVCSSDLAASEITAEVERYMAWPAQALGYKIGQLRLLAMRASMRKAKGAAFDLRVFHEAVMGQGAMPLDLVEAKEIGRAAGRESGGQYGENPGVAVTGQKKNKTKK